jgi:hypothetical protein
MFPVSYRIGADIIMLLHILFIFFVVFGSLLALYRKWIIWLHIPVVLWGVAIEVIGWICPLTPLENALRRAAGRDGYSGGFVEHYLISIIYPDGLTRGGQLVLAGLIIVVNILLYGIVLTRRRAKKKKVFGV